MRSTTRFGAQIPDGETSPPDVPGYIGAALDTFDERAAIDEQGPHSALPAATPARKGMYWWSEDRAVWSRCDGDQWTTFLPQIPIVTSLPSGSASWDGQEVQLQVSTSPPILWHLRRVGSWWVPDGAQVAMYNDDPATRTSISNAWSDFAGASAGQVVLPADGIYHVRYGARLWRIGGDIGDYGELHVGHLATPLPSLGGPLRKMPAAGGEPGSGEIRISGPLGAGAALRVIGKLTSSGALLTVAGRWLAVTPVALVAS